MRHRVIFRIATLKGYLLGMRRSYQRQIRQAHALRKFALANDDELAAQEEQDRMDTAVLSLRHIRTLEHMADDAMKEAQALPT